MKGKGEKEKLSFFKDFIHCVWHYDHCLLLYLLETETGKVERKRTQHFLDQNPPDEFSLPFTLLHRILDFICEEHGKGLVHGKLSWSDIFLTDDKKIVHQVFRASEEDRAGLMEKDVFFVSKYMDSFTLQGKHFEYPADKKKLLSILKARLVAGAAVANVFARACIAMSCGDYREALRIMGKPGVTEFFPAHLNLARAACWHQLGKDDEATIELGREISSNNFTSDLDRLFIKLSGSNWDELVAAHLRIQEPVFIHQFLFSADDRMSIASVLLKYAELEPADYLEIIGSEKKMELLNLHLGVVLEKDVPVRAMQYFYDVLESSGTDKQVNCCKTCSGKHLFDLLLSLGWYERALEFMNTYPAYTVNPCVQVFETNLWKGKEGMVEVMEKLTQSVLDDSDKSILLCMIGQFKHNREDIDGAIECFMESLNENPHSIDAAKELIKCGYPGSCDRIFDFLYQRHLENPDNLNLLLFTIMFLDNESGYFEKTPDITPEALLAKALVLKSGGREKALETLQQ
ncbi:MAG: hypothetical protein PHW04_03655 [Candidatus Wallbacteria bacterium]|nr:hypothetical protein [Candidatus Wallbacteria bacterium]